jgi:hypothetical protein
MGSGYKNFTAASVLTAADLNNYCQSQSVMYFPTIAGAGGRDTVITAPVDGMVAYIGSNDADEGLYTYNGTSWRKGPGWNAPWGLLARNQANGAGTSTSGTTETAVFTSASFTAVANRYYRVNISTTITATAADTYTMRVRQDSTSGTVWWGGNIVFATGQTKQNIHVMGSRDFTAGSHTFLLTLQRTAGVSAQIGTLEAVNMTVEDIGPSGAPA